MNKNIIIAIILGSLILMADIQAFHLFTLKTDLGKVSTATTQCIEKNQQSNLQNTSQFDTSMG